MAASTASGSIRCFRQRATASQRRELSDRPYVTMALREFESVWQSVPEQCSVSAREKRSTHPSETEVCSRRRESHLRSTHAARGNGDEVRRPRQTGLRDRNPTIVISRGGVEARTVPRFRRR